MIYFTLSLTYPQLCILAAIQRGECKPQPKQRDLRSGSIYLAFSHFVTHVGSLKKHGLVEHHQPVVNKTTGGYTITRRGELVLELFKGDLSEAMTLNTLAVNGQSKKALEVSDYVKV